MKLQIKTIFGVNVWERTCALCADLPPVPQVGHEIIDAHGAYYVVQAVRHTPHEGLIEVFVLKTKEAP